MSDHYDFYRVLSAANARDVSVAAARSPRRFHEKLVATHNGIGAVGLDDAQYMTMLVAERLREHGDVAAADHFYRVMSRLLEGALAT